ncbi:MAG: methylated-DNA--[protein]-cysteine S-methyltransferase, partial [Actinomycetota bacterium]
MASKRISNGSDELVNRSLVTSMGTVMIEASWRGVRSVSWESEVDASRIDIVGTKGSEEAELIADRAVAQLEEYFAGTRMDFDLPLDPEGTPFQRDVWRVLRTIPYGETISYGEQARRLGDARKARAVGAANGRNPLGIIVPCHRVIGGDGSLTGFAAGVDTKRALLEHERRHLPARLALRTPSDDPRLDEIFAKGLTGPDGRPLNIFGVLANHPAMLKRWLVFASHVLSKNSVPARERELLILRTGWNCRSPYEWGQHVLIGRDCGLTDDEIDRVKRGPQDRSWSAEDRVLLRAADE